MRGRFRESSMQEEYNFLGQNRDISAGLCDLLGMKHWPDMKRVIP